MRGPELLAIRQKQAGVGETTLRLPKDTGVTVNANTFPGHGGTPFNPNGIRLGTPSVTSRGMAEPEMVEIADLITQMLRGLDNEATRVAVRERTLALCKRFPLPYRQITAS